MTEALQNAELARGQAARDVAPGQPRTDRLNGPGELDEGIQRQNLGHCADVVCGHARSLFDINLFDIKDATPRQAHLP